MSEKRARYDGPSGSGVDIRVELDNGESREVHVDQGGQLPAQIDGQRVAAKFRDSLLAQDTWSEVKQATGNDTKSSAGDGGKKEG